jgi:sulfate permease, SulP family
MLVFNMESVSNIDSTGAHELNEWITTWRKSGMDISMTSIKGPVRDVLNRWAVLESVGSDHIFLDDNTAYQHLTMPSMKKPWKNIHHTPPNQIQNNVLKVDIQSIS